MLGSSIIVHKCQTIDYDDVHGRDDEDNNDKNIPYICHFFTRAKFLESKIYTEKRQFFALNL